MWRKMTQLRNKKDGGVGADRVRTGLDKTAERQAGATPLGPYSLLFWSTGKSGVSPPGCSATFSPAKARSRGPGGRLGWRWWMWEMCTDMIGTQEALMDRRGC